MSIYRATKSAEQYRAEAARHYQNAEDSFERCDTDGALSQWASNVNARVAEALAVLAENGGEMEFTVLADLEGNEVDARPIPTRYGKTCWAIIGDDGKFADFVPYKPARASTLRKRGYQEITKRLPAVVITSSNRESWTVRVDYCPEKWLSRYERNQA